MSLAAIVLAAGAANAEMRVSGSRDALVVEANATPLKEVLNELQQSFKIQYRGGEAFERTISGTYSGSLAHVLSRLLAGRDFAVRSSANGIEIIVLKTAEAPKVRVSAASGNWRDGDGNFIMAPPPPRKVEFADRNAPATWHDGDGNLIAPPARQHM